MKEYDLIHDWYVAERNGETGVNDVHAAFGALPQGSRILDLGCGIGLPLGRLLLDMGMAVHGIDSSPRMLASFRRNCPGATATLGRMEETDLGEALYCAAIAWGAMFHLDDAGQRAAIHSIGHALQPGGIFLFTAAAEADSRESAMNGVAFSYWSLGREAYRAALAEAGLLLKSDYRDPLDHYVYVALKANG